MKCESVKQLVSAYVDLRLASSDRREVERHLESCHTCAASERQMRQLRHALMHGSRRKVPDYLTTSLRVVASRERVRQARYRNIRVAFVSWWERVSVGAGNFMRPLAIPVAGGIFSAVILFSMLVPHFVVPKDGPHDIPTVLFTPATVRSIVPFRDPGGDIVLEVDINARGRVVDYSITKGQALMRDAVLRRAIENNLLFTQFDPPTAFGKPIRGKAAVRFERTDHIDVIG